MSAGYTPGPWGLEYDEDFDSYELASEERSVCELGHFDRKSEREANARLIAAAPALYEAAQKAYDLIRSSRLPGKGPTDAEASLMLALRQARGEA